MDADPLTGRRVVVTRPEHQAGPLCAALERAGAVPVRLALLAIAAIDVPVLAEPAAAYDWVLFTSANGVAHSAPLFGGSLGDSLGRHAGVAAVGPATARALEDAGVRVARVADEHVAESLADGLGDVRGRRVLWPRAEGARDVLADRLRARGARVDEVVVYRSVPAPLPHDARERVLGADAITFASPSAVRAFAASLGTDALGTARVACIGPVTEAAARALGVRVDAVADPYTDAGTVRALARLFEPQMSQIVSSAANS